MTTNNDFLHFELVILNNFTFQNEKESMNTELVFLDCPFPVQDFEPVHQWKYETSIKMRQY